MNKSKAKTIEAIEKAWEIINDKQPETTEEINLIRFAVNTARQLISKPTLDDAIAVVENELKKLQDELPFNAIFKREYKFGIQALEYILTALKGLKEGK